MGKKFSKDMRITVEKLTTPDLLREANDFTRMHQGDPSEQTLQSAYAQRHSPMRTQLFVVRMYQIPTMVSVHLVRHAAVGQLHYVGSNREDRGKKKKGKKVHRYTPVDHMMIVNAQHLEEMAWDRLCSKASPETQVVMQGIKEEVEWEDANLADLMIPRCQYLNRCIEAKPCGRLRDVEELVYDEV